MPTRLLCQVITQNNSGHCEHTVGAKAKKIEKNTENHHSEALLKKRTLHQAPSTTSHSISAPGLPIRSSDGELHRRWEFKADGLPRSVPRPIPRRLVTMIPHPFTHSFAEMVVWIDLEKLQTGGCTHQAHQKLN